MINLNIGVGSLVKSKVINMEDNTREGRSSSIRKYLVGCVQYMMWKNKSLVQFDYVQKREIRFIVQHL